MREIVRIPGNAPWEPIVGYSRAVKAGDLVFVSGTTSTDQNGALIGAGQMYVQARRAIDNIATALKRAGLSIRDVVRTRMFATDVSRLEEIARAHREAFGEAPPATSLVEVRRLVHPDMLFEIEAVAYAGNAAASSAARPLKPAAAARTSKSPKPRPRAKKPAPRKAARRRR